MSKLPPGLTQAEVDEYARLDDGIKRLQARHKELNDVIKSAHTEAAKKGTFTYGKVVVQVTETSKFEKEAATEAFPVTDYPNVYTPVLDPKKLPADVRSEYTSKSLRMSVSTVSD